MCVVVYDGHVSTSFVIPNCVTVCSDEVTTELATMTEFDPIHYRFQNLSYKKAHSMQVQQLQGFDNFLDSLGNEYGLDGSELSKKYRLYSAENETPGM